MIINYVMKNHHSSVSANGSMLDAFEFLRM
jgi:hypothetical protein